jgi:hypothetical protein
MPAEAIHAQTAEAQQIESLTAQLTEAHQQHAAVEHRLEAFRSQVRDLAIDKIKDGSICRSGTNEALEQLGLRPYIPKFVARLAVEVTVNGVEADDEVDARDVVRDNLSVWMDDEDVASNWMIDSIRFLDVEPEDGN